MTEQVNPREDVTVRQRQVIHAPLDHIEETLQRQRVVQEVRSSHNSDFIYGAMFEVDVVEGCSFHLIKTLRNLGLYIEYAENFGDHDTLYIRRISRLLLRQEQTGQFDRLPEYDQ